jgi:Putative auto-transporter adhesin, head GIN domain
MMSARNTRPVGIASLFKEKLMLLNNSHAPVGRARMALPTIHRVLLIALSLLFVALSSHASAAERAFRLTPFSALELDLPARYVIREGSSASARVRGESEVVNRIVVEQHDDRVRIFVPGSITIREQLVIEVGTVGLRELTVDGAGEVDSFGFNGSEFLLRLLGASSVTVGGLDVEKLRVEMQGSGSVAMSGRASRERLRFTGAGQFRAADLAADDVEVQLEGSGDVEVMAREKLDVRLSGAGNVHYRGEPELHSRIDGAGSVTKL